MKSNIGLISAYLLCMFHLFENASLISAFTFSTSLKRVKAPNLILGRGISNVFPVLFASGDDNDSIIVPIAESDQIVIGASGTVMSLITLYSEYTLKTTGCGLPAGPLGLLGAAEGISYLGIVGIAAFSIYTKIRTGSGLPAGPGGLLGAAEGLSFLAILAGVVVLVFQVVDYGYIPNAVPMDGGMCS